MENRLEGFRAGLALITTGVLIVVFALYAAIPAFASHESPDDIVPQAAGTNEAAYWEDTYLPSVRNINDASCAKIDQAGEEAFVMPAEPAGEDWVLLVVKQATTNYVYYDPDAGHSYPSTGDQEPGYSHLIVCSVVETTTTTQATTTTTEGTTTTTEGTTTTTEGTTTTTEGTTTTTEGTTTTTEGTTTTTEGTTTTTEGTTTTTEGSTTTTDDDDDRDRTTTTTTTQPTTTTTQPTTTTTVEVLGTVVTTTTVAEVVASTLPFTGGENDHLAMLAMALLGGGVLIVLGGRSLERSDIG